MKALVVNCSHPHYNLGAEKLALYLTAEGHDVTRFGGHPGVFLFGYDLVCVSVVFSWHAELARDVALAATEMGSIVWAGGPGLYARCARGSKSRPASVRNGSRTRDSIDNAERIE